MSAAYPLNVFDPAVQRDPYSQYAVIRDLGPVVWNPLMGAWMIWRHDDVLSVLNDWQRCSSTAIRELARRQALQRSEPYVDTFGAPTMLNSDPPDHTRYRGVVARAFAPRAVSAQEHALRELAMSLLSPLVTSGSCEIVSTLSSPLPVLAIATMLGVEAGDFQAFRQWSDDFVSDGDVPTGEEQRRSHEASSALRSYFAREVELRRGHDGRSDLLARLVEANEGGTLSDAELLASCVLLLVAGNETTTNLISNMTLQLSQHPDQRDLLVGDPALIPSAVEETLRFDGPVHWTMRIATADLEVSEQPIRTGELMMVLIAAANRDPGAFEDPDTYDVTRRLTNHLGFGHGIHYCLGSTLARLEARVALEALLEVAPHFQVVLGEGEPRYTRSNLRSPRALVVTGG